MLSKRRDFDSIIGSGLKSVLENSTDISGFNEPEFPNTKATEVAI